MKSKTLKIKKTLSSRKDDEILAKLRSAEKEIAACVEDQSDTICCRSHCCCS